MQTDKPRTRPRNRLLSRLPDAEFERLAPHLRTFEMTNKLVLQRPNEHIHEVFFPESGVVSVTTTMLDGSAVEVATVGSEGLVGINAFLGGSIANTESMVQCRAGPRWRCLSPCFGMKWSRPAPSGIGSSVTAKA